eukprot:TRINITY_DN32669_c0_g1_i1.p1 TRINITY_DN32669_c0_g1~~TRINITY_DN32669_c0_g1_i1.p1  ORF type:complete len:382 (-),score=68.43 TRINITY_DN32669_c0_g1_i1:86-1231(-)
MSKRGADTSVVLLERCTRLFQADASKDITFKLSDGEEKAHKCILAAASDVFDGMFQQDMREQQNGVVELPTIDRVSMRIFLRLLYTNHVDPTDWHDAAATNDRGSVVRVLQHQQLQISSSQFKPQAEGWRARASLDVGSRSFQVSVKLISLPNIILGIEPLVVGVASPLGALFERSGGIGLYLLNEEVRSLWVDGKQVALAQRVSVPPNSTVTCTYDSTAGVLAYLLNGVRVQIPDLSPSIFNAASYCPAVTVSGPGNAFEVVELKALECPLGSLLCLAGLAKKYMVKDMVSSSTQALKQRLDDARLLGSTSTFEEIFAVAIRYDLSSLRLAALKAAESFDKLRDKYNAEALKPEVLHELEAIWPAPCGHVQGKPKYFALA